MNRRDLIRNSSLAVMASLTGFKSSQQDRKIKEEENISIDAMDKMASFKELKEKTTIPVATGEHF